MRVCIKNGTVVDPANRVLAKLDLLIEDGKVAELTAGEACGCAEVIDAAGKAVCPGFVDIHSHEDPVGPDGGIRHNITLLALKMGVTTLMGGNCGINACDPAVYLDLLERDRAPVNVGLFCGHTWFRGEAGCTDKYSAIDGDALERIAGRMEESLAAGCFGISFGIRYVPGLTKKELLTLTRLLAGKDKLLTAHVRDDAANVFSAVEELAGAARKWELPAQVSHIGSMGGFGQMEELLRQIDAMRANGLDISGDCYPYNAFSTRIGESTYDDGFLESYGAEYRDIEICGGPYKGMRCTESIFRELRQNAPETITVCHVMKESDVELALLHPNIFLASDGLMDGGSGHPRAAGAFPRFLKNYVRGGRLSLYDAINKMSALPARKLGLTHKGHLGRGADADVAIIDPLTVGDRATFSDPTAPPVGIERVLIGGKTALLDGEIVNAALGRPMRK